MIDLVCNFPKCSLPCPFDLFRRHAQCLRGLDAGQVVHIALDQAILFIRWQSERRYVRDRPFRCHCGKQGTDRFMLAVREPSALSASAGGSWLSGTLCARLVHLHLFRHY